MEKIELFIYIVTLMAENSEYGLVAYLTEEEANKDIAGRPDNQTYFVNSLPLYGTVKN